MSATAVCGVVGQLPQAVLSVLTPELMAAASWLCLPPNSVPQTHFESLLQSGSFRSESGLCQHLASPHGVLEGGFYQAVVLFLPLHGRKTAKRSRSAC